MIILRQPDKMKGNTMRRAIAMIELIFAIVVIAISVLTIPSMLAIANNGLKGQTIDEDILKRINGEIIKVSQARWDRNSTAPDFRPLQITGDTHLPCNRADVTGGGGAFRANPDSSLRCADATNVPMMATAPAKGDLNLSKGIEQLHNKNYTLTIRDPANNNLYTVRMDYTVSYVQAAMTVFNGSRGQATWVLGSSTTKNPLPSGTKTHLKRIVVHAENAQNNVDTTLTFYKSNVGKFYE